MGYNFLPSEISAAFAIEQVKKLKKNIEIRQKNFSYLYKFFSKYNNYFELPFQNKGLKTAWLAFPLLIKKLLCFSDILASPTLKLLHPEFFINSQAF